MKIIKTAYNSKTSFYAAIAAVLLAAVILLPMLFASLSAPMFSATGIQDASGQCYDIEGRVPAEYNGDYEAYEAADPEAAAQTLVKRPSIGCKTVIK